MSSRGSRGGCVDIPYSEVIGYAQGIERIINAQGEMVTFLTNIKGLDYEVRVNREPLGQRAIISSFRVD